MKHLQNVLKISSLQRGDIIQHKITGDSLVVDDVMGNKAIAVTTYHISNPDEWLVLREEVKPDNTNRRETNVLVETENWVDEYIDKHGKSPTYLQVADHFKIGRTASYARLRRYRHKMKTK